MDLDIKKIELEDRAWMQPYFDRKTDKFCDLCFANIYLWKRQYPTGYVMVEDCLVFCPLEGWKSLAFPLGTPEQILRAIPALEELFASSGKPFALHLAGPSDFALLEQYFPGKYQIRYVRDVADYVYEGEKLRSLSGRKYHSKKNHINKFRELYPDWRYEPITDGNVEECFQMALKWRNLNGCEDDPEKLAEMCVSLNALRLMNELRLTGGMLRAGGRTVAFAIGEELNPDMYVVHVEKAFSDVPGAYPMINQQFALHAAKDYPYINREDDSGVPGLRRAKESYHPAFLMEKGVITHAAASEILADN